MYSKYLLQITAAINYFNEWDKEICPIAIPEFFVSILECWREEWAEWFAAVHSYARSKSGKFGQAVDEIIKNPNTKCIQMKQFCYL